MGENRGTSKSRVLPHIRLGYVKLIGCVRLQVEVQKSIRVVGYIIVRIARYLENRMTYRSAALVLDISAKKL